MAAATPSAGAATGPLPLPPPPPIRRSLRRAPTAVPAPTAPAATPIPAPRRRAASLGVARPPPDLQQFLAAEVQPPRGGRRSPRRRPPQPPLPAPEAAPPPRARKRTASVPAVARLAPSLGQRQSVSTGAVSSSSFDAGGLPGDYVRVRSFSITGGGVANLGDSLRRRRTPVRSQTSTASAAISSAVSSLATPLRSSPSTRRAGGFNSDRSPSPSDRYSTEESRAHRIGRTAGASGRVPRFRVAVLGAPGVGKTALARQLSTSEYTGANDSGPEEEGAARTISVMLDGREAELEIVEQPAAAAAAEAEAEQATEADEPAEAVAQDTTETQGEEGCRCGALRDADVFVVVYSVEESESLHAAERLLHLLRGMRAQPHARRAILVGNKADLQRRRQVPAAAGRRVARACGCKFIETSSALALNVDELLVGVLVGGLAGPQEVRPRSPRRLLRRLLALARRSRSCEDLLAP